MRHSRLMLSCILALQLIYQLDLRPDKRVNSILRLLLVLESQGDASDVRLIALDSAVEMTQRLGIHCDTCL